MRLSPPHATVATTTRLCRPGICTFVNSMAMLVPRSHCGSTTRGRDASRSPPILRASACRPGWKAHTTVGSRHVAAGAKGFGSDSNDAKSDIQQAGAQVQVEDSAEALETRIRSNRKGKKLDPKVKVNAPVAEAVNSNKEATPAQRAETAVVLALGYFFLLILVEGLLLAGSGFMPEGMDQWIQDNIYPGYSPTVLLFLGCSSVYGLFKVGRLPGQTQQ